MRRERATALGWALLVAAIATSPVTLPALAFFAGRMTA